MIRSITLFTSMLSRGSLGSLTDIVTERPSALRKIRRRVCSNGILLSDARHYSSRAICHETRTLAFSFVWVLECNLDLQLRLQLLPFTPLPLLFFLYQDILVDAAQLIQFLHLQFCQGIAHCKDIIIEEREALH